MPPMPLTELKCKNAKPQQKPVRLSDSGGLYIEVMPNGSKYWRLKYRHLGKEKRLALGVYPSVSLSEARDGMATAKKQIAKGIDPSFAKRENKRQASLRAENTFESVAREWHSNHKERLSDKYAANLIKRLEQDIFPSLGLRPISEISAVELLGVIKKIEKRGALEISRRMLQACGQVFKYAIATGLAERNIAADIAGALKPMVRTHYAAIETKEIPAFLQTLERNDARLYQQTRNAVRLLMMTFVRTNELIQARWEEFDLERQEWVIPAERMKMRKPHVVPLSRQAVAILKQQKELTERWGWVFPNQVRPQKPMSNNTVLTALKRLGYEKRMTGHGFRALAMSTIKEQLGYRHEVVDRQLAHAVGNKTDRAYDRAQFLDDRKKMMQHWSDYLDAAISQGKVITANFKKSGA